MITLLHGDDIVSSRNRLNELKKEKKYAQVVSLEGKNLDLTTLVQSLSSHSLFGSENLVVIENLSNLNLRLKSSTTILDYMTGSKFASDLIVWDPKVLSAGVISKFKTKGKVELFKQPTVVFSFVDSLMPGNKIQSLTYFQQLLKFSEPEVIFAMMVRQFRLMLAIMLNAQISEMKRIMPWQKGKLYKQAGCFSQKKLIENYKKLLIIDYQTKTGKSVLDLTRRIEEFIINI